ncbi:hypothetical protein CC78DRAFT_486273 [Lojkania enalia]|uniref:Saccharopine dehydrogenase NADP binding domain-containing protein n=1 Tax=Lojkania enalia TaxID=147567 RepID=A0A9P4NBY5_9PLEO|nr:hypothetical protein CC78DRAFT_486273 [Didymosphaeria enalia]
MSRSPRTYELVLLGATGYTGKLTAEWISTNLPSDLKWAIAGRNAKKLQNVVDELTQLCPNHKAPDIETCAIEKDELTILANKTRLLINTVGPFMYYGEPVLAACAENGTHYLDCTGETPWYRDMIDRFDETAKRNSTIVIPQCGLDSVPADMMAFALQKYIRKELNASTLSVIFSLYAVKAGFSGGTTNTAVDLFSHYPLSRVASDMRPFSISPVRPTQPSNPPSASLLYRLFGLNYIPELAGVQTVGLMASIDACMVHRSWGLYQTIAEKSGRADIAYGPRFRFMEYMRAKNIMAGALFRFGVALGGLLLAFPPSRWILTPLIKKFFIPAPGEGPSKETMKKEFMSYRALAIADTDKKEKVLGKMDIAHGGYVITALTLSAAADLILRGDLAATEAGKLGGGILTPATLGEQYLEKLRSFGLNIEVGL